MAVQRLNVNMYELYRLRSLLELAQEKTREMFPTFFFVFCPLENNKFVRIGLKNDVAMLYNQIFEVNDNLVNNVIDTLEMIDWSIAEDKIIERFENATREDTLPCHCACYKFTRELRTLVGKEKPVNE